MRGYVDLNASLIGVMVDGLTEGVAGQGLATPVEENDPGLFFGCGCEEWTCTADVTDEMFNGGFADGYNTILPSLASDFHGGGVEVNIFDGESFELTDSDSGGIHDFDGCPVPDSFGGVDIDLFEEFLDLFMSKDGCGERLGFFDVTDLTDERTVDVGAVMNEFEQSAEAFDLGVECGWFEWEAAFGGVFTEVLLIGMEMIAGELFSGCDPVDSAKPVEEEETGTAGALDGVRTEFEGLLIVEEVG